MYKTCAGPENYTLNHLVCLIKKTGERLFLVSLTFVSLGSVINITRYDEQIWGYRSHYHFPAFWHSYSHCHCAYNDYIQE